MNATELLQENMLDYAGAVNQLRAIPDARTGLKPIHRKILYEMYADKIKSSGKYKKCAYMVGQIIARFSEHGDAATYDALVRLAQPWIQRYPLLDFHGNYGSPFGDPQAAMRYTESKLSKLAEEGFLYGLNKKNVDWMPNFTAEEEEPVTLPAIFPGLFCLPSQGIGYATACNFLTYNLSEVAEGIINYIQTGDFPVLQYDLASGGIIINPQVMNTIYQTGKGSVIVESKYEIQGQKIIITELPFNIMLDDVREEIIKYCQKENYTGVEDVYNSSGKNNLELTIIVTEGYDPQNVINILMTNTKLRNLYGINQVALVDNTPKLLNTLDMVEIYIDHNKQCIKREYEFDLAAAQKRIHILEGLTIALENIDNVLTLIKQSENKATAISILCEKYCLDYEQADAILKMTLSRLTHMDKIAINKELQEKKELALQCQEIIESSQKQEDLLCERLKAFANKYGGPRYTQVIQKEITKISTSNKTKEIIVEDVMIVCTPQGYIKNILLKNYKNTNTQDQVIKCRTDDMILLFSSLGKVFRLKVNEINQCLSKDKGTALGSILTLDLNEKILFITSMNINEKKPYITGVTKKGLVKKSEKEIYIGSTQNKKGFKSAGLNEQDEFISFTETNSDYMGLLTNNNMFIQFELEKINPVGKTAKGVKGINLAENDYVVEVIICKPPIDTIYIKKYNKTIKNIVVQNRGGKGRKIV